MFVIFKKEVSSFLSSLIAYIVIGGFLLALGLMVWVLDILGETVLNNGFANLDKLFFVAPFIFLFLIPAITMRSFAEEKKSGTLEILLTKPLSDWQIIGGKYLAGCFLVLLALLPTFLYVYSIYELSFVSLKNAQNQVILASSLDLAGIMGSYIGLFLLGCVFTSIGIFASSITKDQIVAFVLAVFLCFLLYFGFEGIARIDETADWAYFTRQLGIDFHYNALSKGLITSTNLAYFVGTAGLMLFFTKYSLANQK